MFIQFLIYIIFCVILPYVYIQKQQLLLSFVINSQKFEETIRRSHLSTALITQPHPSVNTLYDLLLHSVSKYSNVKTLGIRNLISHINTTLNLKPHTYYQLSDYEYLTYAQLHSQINSIGSALKHFNITLSQKLTIFCSTSREWLLMAFGCFTQNITITTAYDTLGPDGLLFSINECKVTALFTNADLLPVIKNILPSSTSLSIVIYSPSTTGATLESTANLLSSIKQSHPNVSFYSFDEFLKIGDLNPCAPNPPNPSDIACIMYTSGSTGNPKGVMLSHANMVAGVAGVSFVLESSSYKNKLHSFLAYLPLAHILELLLECYCLFAGIKIGYGSVRTLTDSSVRNCKGDIATFKPHLMAGVPAVWENIRKSILSKLSEASPIQRKIFNTAFYMKWSALQSQLPYWCIAPFDNLVFNKIKKQTGGNLRLLISGGAPIAKETHQFLNVCLANLVQGYGMTECVGACTVQSPDGPSNLGTVGPPTPNTEIKLVSFSKYLSREDRGEVWIRGPTVMKGYYNQPELTAETMTDDWLMTGDIGEWKSDGSLAIIDRKKNLVKLANGEYIALEKLESQYKTSVCVSNICVVADPLKRFPVAIVVPIEKEILKFVDTPMDFQSLCKDPRVIDGVKKSLLDAGKSGGLKGSEIISNLYVTSDEWTAFNGMLTAAQKIKRREIQEKYSIEIETIYRT